MKVWQWIALSIVSAITLVLEPGSWFYMFFGFIGCAVIIFFSKALGKLFLQKKEDYYDVR